MLRHFALYSITVCSTMEHDVFDSIKQAIIFFNVKIGGQVYGLMSIKGERRILHLVESLFKLGLSIDAIQWGGMQNDGHSFFISYNVKIRASSV